MCTDFTAMRLNAAENERQRKMQLYQEQAKESIGAVHKEDAVAVKHQRNLQEQQAQLKMYDELVSWRGTLSTAQSL